MKVNPIVIALLVLILAGIAFVIQQVIQEQGLSDQDPLPVESFVERPRNHLGNRYSLDAQIEQQLDWRRGVGKLLTVTSLQDASRPLPVFLPDQLDESLRVGQRYRMEILVDQDGLLIVEKLEKY